MVGHSSPLTISFSPKNEFPIGGTIELSASSLVLESKSVTFSLNGADEATLTGTYTAMTGYPSTFSVVTSHPYRTVIYSNDTMTMKLSGVAYNSQMSALAIKVATRSTVTCSGSLAAIEEFSDSTNWVPKSPASLGSPTCEVESSCSDTVCTSSTILCGVTPYLDVITGSKVVLDLDGITLSSAPTSSSISITSWTSSQIVATVTEQHQWMGSRGSEAYVTQFSLEGITLPATEAQFRFNITTYVASADVAPSNVVHKDLTSYVNATRRKPVSERMLVETTTSLGTMAAPAVLTVSTPATYTITMKSICGLTAAATFKVSYPAIFSANSTTCATDCVLGSGSILLKNKPASSQNSSIILSFTLINPTSARSVPDSFTVLSSDLIVGAASFVYVTSLPSTVIYQSGEFLSFTVIPGSYKAFATCSYSFSIAVNHRIPAGSSLAITLPSSLTVSGNSATVNSITKSYSVSAQTLNISSAVDSDYLAGSSIIVILSSVTNPNQTGELHFSILARSEGYDIDSKSATVDINLPGDATASCSMENSTNTATTLYSCSFSSSSIKLPLSTSEAQYIDVEISSDLPGCQPAAMVSDTLSYQTMTDTKNFTMMIKSSVSAGSLSSLSFRLNCTNPASTKPATMKMTLYTGTTARKAILAGTASVQTTTGLTLTDGSCTGYPVYPSYPTNVTLQISRNSASTAKIRRVYVHVPSIVESTKCLVTGYSPSAYTCGFVLGNSNGNLLVEFASPVDATQLAFTMIGSTNPSSPTDTSLGYFKARTYAYDGTSEYLVDQSDAVFRLSVSCTFPCKTCELGLTSNCTSCNGITDTKYYYFAGTEKCDVESACLTSAGYFRNDTSLVCEPCQSPCKLCSQSATYCASCLDSAKFVLEGTCVDYCPAKYYKDGITCKLCTSPCYNCSGSNSTCTSCVSGTYLISSNSTCSSACPEKQFGVDGLCKDCDTSCCDCKSAAKSCTSCGCLGLYLYKASCIIAAECNTTHVPVESTHVCTDCSKNCSTCSVSPSQCAKCKGTKALSGTNCVDKCGDQEYMATVDSSRVCQSCDSGCYGCVTNSTTCTSCASGLFLQDDTSTCVTGCKTNYYQSGTHCIPCSSSCATCAGTAFNCTSCAEGLYVYSGSCVSTCPIGTFSKGIQCAACNSSCLSCSGSASYCTACSAGYYLYGSACMSTCPDGTTGVNGGCKACTGLCATCAGAVDYCTSCKTDVYLSEGACVSSCPDSTLSSVNSASLKVCVDCDRGCQTCVWASGSTSVQVCSKCSTGYYMLSSKCYSACPTNYHSSSDGTTCVKDDSSSANAATTSAGYVAFPHLISAGALVFVSIAGQVRDPRSAAVGNTAMMWSYVALCSYVVQAALAAVEGEGAILAVSAVIVVLAVLTNVLFLLWHRKKIAVDSGFASWASSHVCTNKWIETLSGTVSLQTSRLYYSRFIGFSAFFVPFSDFMTLLHPLSGFSFAYVALVYFPIVVLDVVALTRLHWGTQLYVTLIESLILSVLLMLLLCYEMKSAKRTSAELGEDAKYLRVREETSMLQSQSFTESATKKFDEDELRKRILEDVFSRLGLSTASERIVSETGKETSSWSSLLSLRPTKGRVRRRHSFAGKESVDRQRDERETHSYPSSPKAAKSGEAKQPDEEEAGAAAEPKEQPDNVYSEARPPAPSTTPGKMVDASAQTPPFSKIQAFKKKLRDEERRRARRGKKLFEFDANGERMAGPLEPIAESPDDGDENAKAKAKNIPPTEDESKLEPEPQSVILLGEGTKAEHEDSIIMPTEEPKTLAPVASKAVGPLPGKTDKVVPVESDQENLKDISTDVRSDANRVLVPPDSSFCKAADNNPAAAPHDNEIPAEDKENQDGPVIIDALEAAGPSMGEVDSSKGAKNRRRNLHSPPQRSVESIDPVLSAPLRPELPPERKEQEKMKTPAKTLAEVQKTPGLFEESDGFKFSIANLRSSPEANRCANEPAASADKDPITRQEEASLPASVPSQVTAPPPVTEKKEATSDNEQERKAADPEESKKPSAAEEPTFVDDADIMGSFDRDPVDNCILIKENEHSELVDLRGRRVNRQGYLVDPDRNIINRKGEVVFRYEEIAKELGEDSSLPPIKSQNRLFVPPDEAVTAAAAVPVGPAKEEEGKDPAEKEPDSDSRTRKSGSVSSLMEDTPSNYNVQNQRYEDPLLQRRGKPGAGHPPVLSRRPEEYEAPKENDIGLAKAYGGPPRGAPVRKMHGRRKATSQSANRRRPEQLFTNINKIVNNRVLVGAGNRIAGSEMDTGGLTPTVARRARLTSEAENANVQQARQEALSRPKPRTARSNMRTAAAPGSRRAKSRKVAHRDEDQLQRVYNANIEDMFLQSENNEEDGVSVVPSNISRGSNKSLVPKLKGLENIYLQRLESSTKHQMRQESLARKVTSRKGKRETPEMNESERDEISSLLSANFNDMQTQFVKQNTAMPAGEVGAEVAQPEGLFPGNMKLYQQPQL